MRCARFIAAPDILEHSARQVAGFSLGDENMTERTEDFSMISLGPGTEEDGLRRNGCRLSSISGTLRRLGLWLRRYLGLRSVLCEIYSCRQRILLGKKNEWDTSGLDLAQVLASCPKVIFPRNCSGNLAYSMCIRALEKERPYLTLADSELFAQAWFQADRFFRGSSDTLSCVTQQIPLLTPEAFCCESDRDSQTRVRTAQP
jgi:hypothetical protein